MKLKKFSPQSARSAALPAYGIASAAAVVSMAQGGVWASLAIFGICILAAVVVATKLRT